jgi:hypothetical protein
MFAFAVCPYLLLQHVPLLVADEAFAHGGHGLQAAQLGTAHQLLTRCVLRRRVYSMNEGMTSASGTDEASLGQLGLLRSRTNQKPVPVRDLCCSSVSCTRDSMGSERSGEVRECWEWERGTEDNSSSSSFIMASVERRDVCEPPPGLVDCNTIQQCSFYIRKSMCPNA